MAHTIRDKEKLLKRIHRIQGQLRAVENALNEEQECPVMLHTLAACRGAIDSLICEVLEGHVRFHVAGAKLDPATPQAKAVEELIDLLRMCLK